MWLKFLAAGFSGVLSVALLGMVPAGPQPPGPGPGDGPPPKKKPRHDRKKGEPAKKKGEAGPEGDLRRAYHLLRRLRSADGPAGRSEARTRDWTDRASAFYRDGVKALDDGDRRLAHEYGAIAHDLARAVDHARNASLFDRPDEGLPPPPSAERGPESDEGTRRDLTKAYDHLRKEERGPGERLGRRDAEGRKDDRGRAGPGANGRDVSFYRDAARDLYQAARDDLEAGRAERAGELARASEAMCHVVDHLHHIADAEIGGPPPGRPGPPPGGEFRPERDRGPLRRLPRGEERERGQRPPLPPPPDRY